MEKLTVHRLTDKEFESLKRFNHSVEESEFIKLHGKLFNLLRCNISEEDETPTKEEIDDLDVGDVYKDVCGDVYEILEVKGWSDDGNKGVLIRGKSGENIIYYLTEYWVKEIIETNETVEVDKEDLKDIAAYVRVAKNSLEDEAFNSRQTRETLTDAHEWLYALLKEE